MPQLLSAVEHEPSNANGNIELMTLQHTSHQGTFDQDISNQEASNQSESTQIILEAASAVDSGTVILPMGRMVIVIATLAAVSFLSSMSNGLLTVGLPRMALDVGLPEDLLLWPLSAYALTTGSCLLLAGSIADVVGNRLVNLIGCFVVGWFIIACGLARSGIQLIMFRAMQGIAISLCLPTSIAIIATAIPSGRKRNIAFSCLGLVQPLGFSMGLVLEGVIQEAVGWRLGFYLCGGLTLGLFLVSIWALPPDGVAERSNLSRLRTEIDWIGATIACACLAVFSYLLATLANGLSNIGHPASIAMLTISVALVPTFVLWERRQERRQKPALIPNSLWRNTVFTSVCIMMILSYAVVNAMELFCSLFFQSVQGLSALQASVRILPNVVVGVIAQLSTGLLIHRISAFYLLVVSLVLSAGAPLLMALIDTRWPYWYDAFLAQALTPLSVDILFTVGLLVVSDVFPTRTQALAGAVFNTVAQFGTSIGLSIMAVISSSATQHSKILDKTSPDALMVGYRAAFWAAFAWMGFACLVGGFGLRRIGKIGLKRD